MKIGIDVDGILANFFTAYENLFIRFSGEDKFPGRYPDVLPPVWMWPEHYGYDPWIGKVVWDYIKHSPTFWKDLGGLPGSKPFLDELSKTDYTTYFITDRPGIETQKQTAQWLIKSGYIGLPSVIISADKAAVCKALGVSVYIDDRPSNVISMWDNAPEVKTYMLKYPYNSELHDKKPEFEVNNLTEFIAKANLWEMKSSKELAEKT